MIPLIFFVAAVGAIGGAYVGFLTGLNVGERIGRVFGAAHPETTCLVEERWPAHPDMWLEHEAQRIRRLPPKHRPGPRPAHRWS